jgi:hypothetical protein
MRPEQITTLSGLEEQLVDLFAHECTPRKWIQAKDPAERDAGYKEKKVALATVQLIGRIQNVLRDLRDAEPVEPKDKKGPKANLREEPEDDAIEREAARLEREGRAVLRRHGKAS